MFVISDWESRWSSSRAAARSSSAGSGGDLGAVEVALRGVVSCGHQPAALPMFDVIPKLGEPKGVVRSSSSSYDQCGGAVGVAVGLYQQLPGVSEEHGCMRCML
jgi:hypothetical protein